MCSCSYQMVQDRPDSLLRCNVAPLLGRDTSLFFSYFTEICQNIGLRNPLYRSIHYSFLHSLRNHRFCNSHSWVKGSSNYNSFGHCSSVATSSLLMARFWTYCCYIKNEFPCSSTFDDSFHADTLHHSVLEIHTDETLFDKDYFEYLLPCVYWLSF